MSTHTKMRDSYTEALELSAEDLIKELAAIPAITLESHDAHLIQTVIAGLDHPLGVQAVLPAAQGYVARSWALTAAWDSGNWDFAFDMLGSNARLPWMIAHRDDLTPVEGRPLLLRAWTEPNLIIGGPSFDYDEAVDLFEWATQDTPPIVLTDDPTVAEWVRRARPVLYRGDDVMHRPSSEPWDGLSWTWHRNTADWFARQRSGRVWQLDLADYPGLPFAVVTGRDESEVILDPARCPEQVVEL